MKNLKHIIPAIALSFMSMTSIGQGVVMVEESMIPNNGDQLMATIGTDMKLTSRQQKSVNKLDAERMKKIRNVQNQYKMNDEVYLNKIRLINEEYDLKLRDYLTLEQYAIYLNNNRSTQYYDSEYEGEDVFLKRESDGDVKFKDDVGTIIIQDDKFVVKNDLADTKLKVTDDKIKFKDDDLDRKVKIKDDKIIVKEDGEREVIETDEVEYEDKDNLVEIEIDLED